jgi:hypothetical protein
MQSEQTCDVIASTNISVDEVISSFAADRGEVLQISGIGQFVVIDQSARPRAHPPQHEIRANESSTTSNDYQFIHRRALMRFWHVLPVPMTLKVCAEMVDQSVAEGLHGGRPTTAPPFDPLFRK